MVNRELQLKAESCLAERLLAGARRSLPVIDRVLGEQGNETLDSYLSSLEEGPTAAYQTRDDLLDWLRTALDPLLGKALTRSAIHDLACSPTVLTAGHHGVDSIAQSFQNNLLFALHRRRRYGPEKTIWIFSCGNIPLNNSEYPRGLLYYHLHPESDRLTMKFPIFPDRLKRCMVSVAPALDLNTIARAELRLNRLVAAGQIPQQTAGLLHRVLREDYGDTSILALADYSEQSLFLNRRIWKRLFVESADSPNVVYFELEKVVGAMLIRDLLKADSLVRCILFDRVLRESVLHQLDGRKGCWHLAEQARKRDLSCRDVRPSRGFGTVFFWGVDERRRRVPLHLKTGCAGNEVLSGIDDQGRAFQVDFTPQDLVDALRKRRLLPSLFSCFVTLSFARGLVCIGGYFQAEYLPIMQRGLMRALAETAGYRHILPLVGGVPAGKYLSGMQAVMVRADNTHLIPAGPLQIIAGGGISTEEEQILRLTVREAHLAGLFETAPDAFRPDLLPKGWQKQLARDCHELLGRRVVVK